MHNRRNSGMEKWSSLTSLDAECSRTNVYIVPNDPAFHSITELKVHRLCVTLSSEHLIPLEVTTVKVSTSSGVFAISA
ncbi:hypothetical protein M0804_006457 [Polistes exclamans]|nr:hypothetical protein M0804_006457 [Polistes exclamans]